MSRAETPATADTPGEAEVRALLERARGGDREAVPALRQALDEHPEIWQAYGDLAMHARVAWIELIAGTDLTLKESLERKLAAMKADLAGPDPTPLESLLVERIAACWLQAYYADATATQVSDVSLQQANYARKRQDSAHRRYVTAIGALAMVRKLIGPPGPKPIGRLRAHPPADTAGDARADPGRGHPPGRPGR